MRIAELLLEYDRVQALAVLGTKFRDAVIKDYIGYYGNNWSQASGAASLLADPRLPSLVDRAMQRIEAADPTPNKKYTLWMARQFASGHPSVQRMEDVESTLGDYVHKFHQLNLKKRLASPLNDINRYKDVGHFMDEMDQHELETDQEPSGQADRVYKDADVLVIVPRDQAAACKYGRQTRWCTASVHATNYFDRYNSKGPLHILIPKNPAHKREKYQLHFATFEYMDEENHPVGLNLLNKKFPGLFKWFKTHGGPDIQRALATSISLMPTNVLQSVSDQMWNVVRDQFLMPLLDEMEMNDDTYWDWLRDNGFVDEDNQVADDAPSYSEYNPEWQTAYNSVETAVHLSAKEMKDIADALGGENDIIFDWEMTLADWIDQNRYPSDRYLRQELIDFLKSKVIIRQTGDQLFVSHTKA